MPSYHCKNPLCDELLSTPGYCAKHQPLADEAAATVEADYDLYRRDPAAREFYQSTRWRRTSAEYTRRHPICEQCGNTIVAHVHHKIPLSQCTEEQKFDDANLMSVCVPCHNELEARARKHQTNIPTAIGTLQLAEDDLFYFDAEAAEKRILFIEKWFTHYEGALSGQPFKLLEWQKEKIFRPLFGWKHRSTNFRRFTNFYIISGKGAGKTPLLTFIGLAMLLIDGEAAPHVISMAGSREQAGLTFDAAKIFIEESPIYRHPGIDCKQHHIEGPGHGKWTVVSGKNKGRSGSRPSCCLADEIHEYGPDAIKNYRIVTSNMFKRRQPLLINSTNAGEGKTGLAWELHERAVACLNDNGKKDPTFLPLIFEAPRELDWTSEAAARAANPSIPNIVTFDQIKPKQLEGEASYRRLYLSQWVTGTNKWINIDTWDSLSKPFDPAELKDAPLYVGIDMSDVDDMCAAAFVFVTPERFFIDCRFWIPRATAQRYEEKELIPYSTWELDKAITLLDTLTISEEVESSIAAEIIAMNTTHPIQRVGFDPAYATKTVAEIEAKLGVGKCVAVRQGWTVSHGCKALAGRMLEKTIQFQPNPVLRFCAQNVEVFRDKKNNYWPIKPGANQTTGHTGKRAFKIDGISAIATAMTEARRHNFPKQESWAGAFILEA